MARLLIDQNLAPGVEIALDVGQARHVGTVLRLEVGDDLRVFNAVDGEWSAVISAKAKRGVNVRVQEFLRPGRLAPDLDLLFAPVKRQATDLIVEKATELGVRRIRPVNTQRTIAETVRLDRLNAIAREAAEQTERLDAPEILPPVSLARALDGWDQARPLIFCDEERSAVSLFDALTPLPLEGEGAGVGVMGAAGVNAHATDLVGARTTLSSETPPPRTSPSRSRGGRTMQTSRLALLVGPEGGFTAAERAELRALAFVTPVSLGPRILRADTAVIAALSIIQAVWGDWRQA